MSILFLTPRRRSVIGGPARITTVAAVLLLLLADGAQAQGFLGRIKDAARQKAVSAAARAAGNVAQKTGQIADTALSVGVAGTDSASGRVVGAAGSVVDRVQAKLPGVAGGRPAAASPSAPTPAVLAPTASPAQGSTPAGPRPDIPTASEGMPPLPLHGAVFVGRADTLSTASIAYLNTLAQSLREMGNSFVVVATVSPTRDRTRDQARADRRAAAVKAALVAGGATSVTIAVMGRVESPAPDAPAGGITLVKQS